MDQDPHGDRMYQDYINFGKEEDLFSDWKKGGKHNNKTIDLRWML